MVSSQIISNFNVKDKQVTLCDWIGKVKGKKREIRRKRSSQGLRIAAMLTTALIRAEDEMRRKQQERAMKWAELHIQIKKDAYEMEEAEAEQRQRDISELWQTELNGLDSFINNFNQIKTNVVR